MSKREDHDYGFTLPPTAVPTFGYGRDDGKTEYDDHGFRAPWSDDDRPKDGRTVPDSDIVKPENNDNVNTVVIDDGPKDSEGKTVQVVVGWLVGIEGLSQGIDFRLHSGQNKIGRHSDMDVSLRDNRISRSASIEIYYDPMGNQFFASNGGGKCLAYVNRKLLMGNQELHPFDRIQLGIDKRGTVEIISELLFVPLCGEKFSWAEIHAQKDEK